MRFTTIFATVLATCSLKAEAINVWDDTLTFLSQNGLQDDYVSLSLQQTYPLYNVNG